MICDVPSLLLLLLLLPFVIFHLGHSPFFSGGPFVSSSARSLSIWGEFRGYLTNLSVPNAWKERSRVAPRFFAAVLRWSFKMSRRKWKETEQHLIQWLELALLGCCLYLLPSLVRHLEHKPNERSSCSVESEMARERGEETHPPPSLVLSPHWANQSSVLSAARTSSLR